jgi:hypothetical protein
LLCFIASNINSIGISFDMQGSFIPTKIAGVSDITVGSLEVEPEHVFLCLYKEDKCL